MLKKNVIANSITNLTDARYFAAWEVDWLGFCFDQNSENFIAPESALAIKEWVDGVRFIGEFGNVNAQIMNDLADRLSLEAIQVDDLTGIDVLMDLRDLTIFKTIHVDPNTTFDYLNAIFEQFEPYCQHFIIKFSSEMPSFIHQLSKRFSIWIDGHFEPETIEFASFKGVCLRGGIEEKVGLKSFDELDAIFEWLEKD